MALSNFKGVFFKEYNQSQLKLLPPSLDELIPAEHISRVINRIIDSMDEWIFMDSYSGGGTSSYHPKMLAKIIVYSYITRIYSGRAMARQLKENVVYMWLSGSTCPDFRTINRFRSERFKAGIRQIFQEVLRYCNKVGLVKYENYFIDGTKMEANANRHKIVWRKNVERHKVRTDEKIEKLLDYIDSLVEEEEREADECERREEEVKEKLGSKESQQALDRIIERLNRLNKEDRRAAKKATAQLKKLIPRQQRYEHQQEILGGRNSYSKTDRDAIGMRMKDEVLRAGYNVMVGTENQVVLNYDVHSQAGDTACFREHMENCLEHNGCLSKNIVGDAGFGSEENYQYLEDKGLGNYLKYNTFYQESKKKFSQDRTKKENFRYDKRKDEYICLSGKRLKFIREEDNYTKLGYKQTLRIYEGVECARCLDKCTTAKYRCIQVNRNLERHKNIARRNLTSELGIALRKMRGVEVETIFGDIKRNFGFSRFNLRGKEKVSIEIGLLCLSHNLKKLATVFWRDNGLEELFSTIINLLNKSRTFFKNFLEYTIWGRKFSVQLDF